MIVGQLCQRKTVTVSPKDELVAAARLMRERHVGYLVVVEEDPATEVLRPIGVLTDRDIVIAVIAKEAELKALRAGDVMNPQPVVIEESQSIEAALQQMRRAGVRRLPVIGRRGELSGVLSLDDVLDYLAGQVQNVAGAIRNERQIEGTVRS